MDFSSKINNALKSGLLESAAKNLSDWINTNALPQWALNAIDELFAANAIEELNDRFFKDIEFGTAGMRGRTIGKLLTKSEEGKMSEQGTPEFACIGSNNMNDLTVAKATLGLFKYCKEYCDKNSIAKPVLVIAYDVRHFSKHFCDLSASLWTKCGGEVYIFDGARSTPQLSYTVRRMKALAGVVITASHNPYFDNGYKVYFDDGAQATSPHAEGIVAKVKSCTLKEASEYLDIDLSKVKIIDKSIEKDYINCIEDCVIDKSIIKNFTPKVVYSAIHGTGAVLCPDVMRHFGLSPILVESQMQMDARFPTVKQPNPEYAETMALGVKCAEENQADCLLATDPDSDRMGAAIPSKNSKMRLITGNMIGSLLLAYRIEQMKAKKIITNEKACALIKTFVTSPLQDAIANKEGLKCVNVLTGFKWIGSKLLGYEKKLEKALPDLNYAELKYSDRAKLLQEHSTFFVFGGEESYGYLGTDFVRDKDANAAVIMFCEMLGYLKSQNISVEEYLDRIYLKYGYYLEDLKSIYYEGSAGASKIKNILKSLNENPMQKIGDVEVSKSIDFAKDKITDADGEIIPKETFFFYTLKNGYSFAIRGSGTEPKIKFYVFAKEDASDAESLEKAKLRAREGLDKMIAALTKEADTRALG